MSAAVHHLEDCVYLPEVCPLGCVSLEGEKKGEVVRMERRHIPGHVNDSCPLREIVCEFCEGKVKASEMNPHLKDCEEFPLDCPNGCSGEGEDGVREVKRKDIPVHLDNHCPLQKVQCPYWDHGCREEMERRHTDAHEREFLHVHFKLSLTETKQKQNESTQVTQRLQPNLDTANEKIAVQEESLKLSRAELNAATRRIVILEEQNSDKGLKIASLTKTLFTYTQLPTGRLEWKVEGIKQKIQNKEYTYSDPFYVGLYKCQGCIDWDYINKGKVGVFIHIMKGDFDDKLHWPIRYKRTIILTNQINNKDNLVKSYEITKELLEKFPQCFNRPTGIKNDGLGHDSFISNTDILEDKYCKQDSVTLHFSVEVLPSL